jgi:hypothetical protein
MTIEERGPKPHKKTRFAAEPSTMSRTRKNRSRSPVEERRPARAGRRTPSGYSTGSGIPERERMPYNRTAASPRTRVSERERRPYSKAPFSPQTQVHERERRIYSHTPEPTHTHRTEIREPRMPMPDIIREGYEHLYGRAQKVMRTGAVRIRI